MPDDRFGKGTSSTTKATKKGIENIIKQANTAGSQQFLSGNVSASDRRDQITDLANLAQDRGVDFNLNTEEFTGNERGISNADPTGKLREGMTGDEYHLFMRGLHKANPAAMETAFPFSSGAGIRNIATALTPLKYLKALGSGAKEGLANLGHKLAPGLTEALGFHKNKFMNDLSNVGPGLKKEFKKLAGLNSTEESLLNTINKEMTSSQKSAQELLQAGNEDWTDAILGDDIKDAETTFMNYAEKEYDDLRKALLAAIAYDPTEDLMNIDPYSDRAKRLGLSDVWSDSYVPSYPHPSYQTDQTDQTDILDVSQNRMPHVPITHEQKKRHVEDAMGFEPGFYDDRWAEIFDEDISEKEMSDRYDFVRGKQDKGLEYKPWEGVVSKKNEWGEWQLPGTSEIQDQIRWNTANRPLDWSETPELTEDLIKENITGGTDWGWNKGGYLKKFDDGGYANMSTYEKLKAINDSIAEG